MKMNENISPAVNNDNFPIQKKCRKQSTEPKLNHTNV